MRLRGEKVAMANKRWKRDQRKPQADGSGERRGRLDDELVRKCK